MSPLSDAEYCARQVRKFDSDRYVTALFATPDRRAGLFALYAFNIEVANSREAVSEPFLGRIRLQWWRDAVSECYAGGARRHQVVQPLEAAIQRHGLDREQLERILDARESDMDPSRPERLEQMIAYAGDTAGALNELALQILGVSDHKLMRAAQEIGTAWALAGMIRGLGYLLRVGRRPLPADVMDKFGLTPAALESLKPSTELNGVIEEISKKCLNYLDNCHAVRSASARPVLLQAVLARAYLKRLGRTGYNPYDARNLAPLNCRAWRLLIPALTGRV